MAGAAALAAVIPAGAQQATPAAGADVRDLATRYIETVWNTGDVAAIPTFISPAFVPGDPSQAPGVDASVARTKAALAATGAVLTHLGYTVEHVTVEGGTAVVRGFITGVSRSGANVRALYLEELRVGADGLIVGSWVAVDVNAIASA